jgi:hypothetical protein
MSSSTLYAVFRTTATRIAEYRNSYGTAPAIWGHMCEEYLHEDRSSWLFGVRDKGLWDLAKNPAVPEHLRLCHVFTFDHALVPRDCLGRMADALNLAYSDLIRRHPNHVNHWQAIAADLRKAKVDRRALGIGLGCTSVADPWASYRHTKGEGSMPFDCVAWATLNINAVASAMEGR